MATYYSNWNSKSYSWGTAKTRCRLVITTSQSNTAVSISISGAVQCDGTYNISDYGVQVTVGNNSASGASAHSDSNTGVFDGGTGWKASASTSCSATRKTSAYSVSCYSKYAGKTVSGYGGCSNSGSVSRSVRVPARASYKVTYNANGGTGAPGTQTKYYGTTLKLSSKKPTRTGYTFKGWATSASSSTVAYKEGANYSSNAAITLYAVWQANTYTITFNANGGTGGPTTVTKTYGKALTLPTAVPTRQYYNFKGWATTAEASTAQYQAGGSYTVEGAATLYAVWELAYIPPSITNFSADRCTSSGSLTDGGTYVLVKFSWKTDNKAVQSIKIGYKLTTATSYTYVTVAASGTSGSVSKVIGDNKLSTDYEYDISVVIADTMGSSTYTSHINSMSYIIDFLKGGKGVAIGKPSTQANMSIAWPVDMNKTLNVGGTSTHGGLATFNGGMILANNQYLSGKNSSGSAVNVLRVNSSNQVELNWTSGGLKGRIIKQLWSGSFSPNGSATISVPDTNYYQIFIGTFANRNARVLLVKNASGTQVAGTAAYTDGTANSFTRYAIKINISGNTWSAFKSVAAYDDSAAFASSNVLTKIEGVL